MATFTQFSLLALLLLVTGVAVVLSIGAAFGVSGPMFVLAFLLSGAGLVVGASMMAKLLCLLVEWTGRMISQQCGPVRIDGNSTEIPAQLSPIEIVIAAAGGIPDNAAGNSIRFLIPPVEDAAIVGLADLTELKWVVLDNTNVSDVGLAFLHRLTKLRRLYVRGSKVTNNGVQRLQLALPDVVVVQ